MPARRLRSSQPALPFLKVSVMKIESATAARARGSTKNLSGIANCYGSDCAEDAATHFQFVNENWESEITPAVKGECSRLLSPHLTASPSAHSLGEVIFPAVVFDTENFSVLDCLQFLSLVQLPRNSQYRELFASV